MGADGTAGRHTLTWPKCSAHASLNEESLICMLALCALARGARSLCSGDAPARRLGTREHHGGVVDASLQQLTWYWQLQGAAQERRCRSRRTTSTASKTARPPSRTLHGEGRKRVICYIDVGTAENFRPDYNEFPASVLGHSNGWPGERWLDIRALEVVEPIMSARFQMCR